VRRRGWARVPPLPGADKLATECLVNLLRTQGLVTAELARPFRRHGLTGPGFNVLMILEGAGQPPL